MKLAKKILLIFLLIMLAVILLLSAFLLPSFDFVKYKKLKIEYSNVFRQSFADNLNVKITDIAMLGAHDAFTSNINRKSSYDIAEDSILTKIKIIKGFAVRVSKAQNATASQLLAAGVRYFDVRLTYDKKWLTKHVLYNNSLETNIKEILTFLENNRGEFVLLDFQHVFLNGQSYGDLFEHLSETTVNGKSIFDYIHYKTFGEEKINLENLTYNDVTKGGQESGAVLLFKDEPNSEFPYFYNRDQSIRSNWHNQINTKKILAKINEEADYINSNYESLKGILRVNQAQKSANTDGDKIFETVTGWSLLGYAKKYNSKVLEHKNFNSFLKAMPICMFDFVNNPYNDFNNKINKKIIEYNDQLRS